MPISASKYTIPTKTYKESRDKKPKFRDCLMCGASKDTFYRLCDTCYGTDEGKALLKRIHTNNIYRSVGTRPLGGRRFS